LNDSTPSFLRKMSVTPINNEYDSLMNAAAETDAGDGIPVAWEGFSMEVSVPAPGYQPSHST